MKPLQTTCLLLSVLVLPSCALRQPVTLMPGVSYYDGPEKLTGKLTFLLSGAGKQEDSAAIYEFDLSSKQLRKVTDSRPSLYFVAPDRGDTYCVIYGPFEPSGRFYTNAFIHSDSLGRERTLHLDERPSSTYIAGGYVFFEIERAQGDDKVLRYDVALDQLRPCGSSDATWQRRRDADYSYQAFDGRYILFEGSGAPSEGFTLVSSPIDCARMKVEDPKGKNVKVLHRFSVLRVSGGGYYILNHMSPDGRYAVVTMEEPTLRKTDSYQGWARTYYAVDAANGKVRLLLKENVEHVTGASMSGVWWVGD